MKTGLAGNLGRAAWLGLWLALAAALCVWAWPQQLERGCWLAEWPFELGCRNHASGHLETTTAAQQRAHLQRNVGDGRAYLWLATSLARQSSESAAPLLPWLQELTPHHDQALALQADAGLRSGDYDSAAKALTLLVERRQAAARAPLVAMMREPAARDAVRARLTPQSRWLDPLLVTLGADVPAAALLTFASEGWKLGVLRDTTMLRFIERLQRDGAWLDAYSLWVALLGRVHDGLFNAGFDHAISQRGFDWRWPKPRAGKVGTEVTQVSATPRPGRMLRVELTERAPLPAAVVSQPLVLLGSPRYQLEGRYMSERLRSHEGLVWALRCAAGGQRFAQSEALEDTEKQWRSFTLDFAVPAECGGAVQLRLEATAAWEARAGMVGVMYFDDFELRARVADVVAR